MRLNAIKKYLKSLKHGCSDGRAGDSRSKGPGFIMTHIDSFFCCLIVYLVPSSLHCKFKEKTSKSLMLPTARAHAL